MGELEKRRKGEIGRDMKKIAEFEKIIKEGGNVAMAAYWARKDEYITTAQKEKYKKH